MKWTKEKLQDEANKYLTSIGQKKHFRKKLIKKL